MTQRSRPRLLIVAGHDPSGGAGVDADREAVKDCAVEASFVVTARTEQDDREVRSIGARDAEEWGREARAIASEGLAALKFGLLPGAEHVRAAHELVAELRRRAREVTTPGAGAELPVVLDPVLSASSGARFLDAQGVEVLRGGLLCDGVILTPNLPEAAEIACEPLAPMLRSPEARLEAAWILLALGAAAVVIKGGHGEEDPVRDLVAFQDGRHSWHEHPRVAGGKLRGTGCRFASRLAAELATGQTLEASADAAGRYVAARIQAAAGRRT